MTSENGNGRRWYDSSRVIAGLFSVVVFCAVAWGTFVFSTARGAESKNIEQDGRINQIMYMLEKMDGKLDKVLDTKR